MNKKNKKVILRVTTSFGRKLEVINVKRGFYNNFLRQKKIAVLFSEKQLEILKNTKEQFDPKLNEIITKQFNSLNNNCMFFVREASNLGVMFGSISNRDVSTYLKKEFNFDIDRRNIEFENVIKKLGIYNVNIKLSHETYVKVKISVARNIDEAKKQMLEGNNNE